MVYLQTVLLYISPEIKGCGQNREVDRFNKIPGIGNEKEFLEDITVLVRQLENWYMIKFL